MGWIFQRSVGKKNKTDYSKREEECNTKLLEVWIRIKKEERK